MSAIYVCPTCGERMDRDLTLFIRHTDAHVVEQLKKINPNWITPDGFCHKCLEHYKAVMRGEEIVNIGGGEVAKRQTMAVLGLLLSLVTFFGLSLSGAPRSYRALLFLPLFAAFLGFFQAKKNHCVVLGLKGTKNMGSGEVPLRDTADRQRLRRESVRILLIASALAIGLTAVGYFLV